MPPKTRKPTTWQLAVKKQLNKGLKFKDALKEAKKGYTPKMTTMKRTTMKRKTSKKQ